MKKIILVSLLSLLIFSCKSTTSATATKLDNKTEVGLKGDWKISSVTYPGSDVIKVTSFDLADSKCFIGSTWKFISNNNKGQMTLTNPNCTGYSTPITWFINKEGQFVMKILDEAKSKTVKSIFCLVSFSISVTKRVSLDEAKLTARPSAPARPVRPIR
jgi:hypothetical protein